MKIDFKKITKFFAQILVNSPFYPHWLQTLKIKELNRYLFTFVRGDCLEVGCGNLENKTRILKMRNKKIRNYLATDYLSWDETFRKYNRQVDKLGFIGKILYGRKKDFEGIDMVCDAMNLPFDNESFDTYLCFEVLEHISHPDRLFSEASRVLRQGGYLILTTPFLFRIHGGEDNKLDFFRYADGAFYKYAEENSLVVREILINTGIGTSVAEVVNQFLIRRIQNSKNWVIKMVFFLPSPFVFALTNMVGYLIDLRPDKVFANRYHVIFLKK